MGSSKRRRPVSLLGAVSNHHHHGSGSHPSTWAERSRTHRRRATCPCEEAWLSRSQSFRVSLKTNPKLVPASGQQLLDLYRHYLDAIEPQLPKLFGLLPKTKVEVRPVEKYREKEAAAAQYYDGTPDGSRPGVVLVNTGDYQHRSLTDVESTTYHEGLPGHHMQIAIAQTLPELPKFRQQGGYTAYTEGWGLYAESLGKELGLYQDPYSDYGRLTNELWRAVRLVVDTGVHYKHWTRQQMVDFF